MTTPPDFEPFRAVAVQPIQSSTHPQRRQWLKEAEHNLFRLRSDQVMIDLLTDSGTGVMSSEQWSAMMRGDESYAGSQSYFRLQEVIRGATGMPHMLPVHQGRVAERLLVESVIGKHPSGAGMIVPNNAHFDTTRCMIEASGAETVNLLMDDVPVDAASDEAQRRKTRMSTLGNAGPASSLRSDAASASFKGNMDVHALERLLRTRGEDVPFVMMTVTCNSIGGQPVSLENLREVRAVCNRFGKMLFLDACRYAENAWFIQRREAARHGGSSTSGTIASIVREMFDLADGAVMSTRKDALCNVGGLLLMRDEHFYRKACNLCVLTDGFQMTYGTLPGRDLEALAVGLQESLDETYLTARVEAVQRLAHLLTIGGIRVLQPVGGHAVFIDAAAFCPHLSRAENPAHSLACAIYEHAGVRSTRIGTALKNDRGEPMEFVRLAIPRRRYSPQHLDYVAASIIDLKREANRVEGMKAALPATVNTAMADEPAFQAA